MKKLIGTAIAIALCLSGLGGCKRYEPVLPPEIRMNPKPVDQYRVLLRIPEPPGPMYLTADISYGISNKTKCVPLDRGLAIGGIHPTFGQTRSIPIIARSATEYEVIFYGDAVLSEDYYGLGPCEWSGGPIITLAWATEAVVVQAMTREEDLDVVHIRLCPFESASYKSSCVPREYAKPEVQKNFDIELITTRSRL